MLRFLIILFMYYIYKFSLLCVISGPMAKLLMNSPTSTEQATVTAVLLSVLAARFAASAVAVMHTLVLSGQQQMNELLDGHEERFYDAFGMKKQSVCSSSQPMAVMFN